MPIPIQPPYFSLRVAPTAVRITVPARPSGVNRYEYRIGNGSWLTLSSYSDRERTTLRSGLSAEGDYRIDVRSDNSDGESSPLSTDFETPIASTASVRWSNMYCVLSPEGSEAVYDIAAAVEGAHRILPVYGLRKWLRYADGRLTVTRVPIADKVQEYHVRFRAEGRVGSPVHSTLILKVFPSKKASLSKSLYLLPRGELKYEGGRLLTSRVTVSNTDGVDFVVLISEGVDSYTLSGVVTNRTIPETVTTVEGGKRSTTFDGVQYDMLALETPLSSGTRSLTLNGIGPQLHALLFLNLGYELSGFADVIPGLTDRTGGLHEEIRGGVGRYVGLSDARWKYTCEYMALFEDPTEHEDFLMFAEENPHFVHVEAYTRRPHRIYDATWGNLEYTSEYITRFREIGNTLQFSVEER